MTVAEINDASVIVVAASRDYRKPLRKEQIILSFDICHLLLVICHVTIWHSQIVDGYFPFVGWS